MKCFRKFLIFLKFTEYLKLNKDVKVPLSTHVCFLAFFNLHEAQNPPPNFDVFHLYLIFHWMANRCLTRVSLRHPNNHSYTNVCNIYMYIEMYLVRNVHSLLASWQGGPLFTNDKCLVMVKWVGAGIGVMFMMSIWVVKIIMFWLTQTYFKNC